MVLKDDNLGLGAKGLQHDLCTGLDAFQGLLDSLNGKAKGQATTHEQIYQDTKPAVYEGLGKKGIRFVSGGFLKGREQEERAWHPVKTIVPLSEEQLLDAKLSDRPVQSGLACEHSAPQRKNSRKKDRPNSTESELDKPVTKSVEVHSGNDSALDSALEAHRKRKADRKLRRRKEKELRRAAQSDVQDFLPTMSSKAPARSPIMTAAINPLDRQAELRLGGRHAIRQKYIRHKKMAMMDSKAMNEVSQTVKVPNMKYYELTTGVVN